jgi:hypothetical protein
VESRLAWNAISGPHWPQTWDPSASASQALGLPYCTITTWLKLNSYQICKYFLPFCGLSSLCFFCCLCF